MARNFAGGTDKVEHTSATVLDNMTVGTVVCPQCQPSTLDATIRPLIAKAPAVGANGMLLGASTFGGAGRIRMFFDYPLGTDFDYESASNTLDTTNWWFVAGSFDRAAATPFGKLYYGGPTMPVHEPVYAVSVAPSGTYGGDADGNLTAGSTLAGAFPYVGKIGAILVFRRVLVEWELEIIRKRYYGIPCDQPFPALDDLILESRYDGGGTEIDRSGWVHDGTPTGTTIVDSPSPVKTRFSFSKRKMLVRGQAVVAGAGWNPLLSHTRNRLLSGVA